MPGAGRLHCWQIHYDVLDIVAFLISTSGQEIDMRMNTILKTLLGVAAAAAMLGAATIHAQATAGPGQKPAASSMPAAAPASAPLSKADQKIVMDMALGNMAEIELAKLAESKSQSEQVKTFAKQMMDDHTKALTEVQQLATTKGVTMPAEIDKAHKAMADKLGAMSGDAFDKAYMKEAGVADHKKMHSMLASARKKAKDPEVKALAGRIQPTVEQHLKAAQQMKSGKGEAKMEKPPAATAAGK
jgi:putative membrane protein